MKIDFNRGYPAKIQRDSHTPKSTIRFFGTPFCFEVSVDSIMKMLPSIKICVILIIIGHNMNRKY